MSTHVRSSMYFFRKKLILILKNQQATKNKHAKSYLNIQVNKHNKEMRFLLKLQSVFYQV